MKHERSGIVDLLRSPAFIDLDRGSLFFVALASVAMNLLLFSMPIYTLQIYDRVLTSRSIDTLLLLTLIVLFALTATVCLDAVRGRLLLRVGNKYMLKLGPRLLDASIVQSATLADPNGQGLRDLQTVRGFISGQPGLGVLFDAPLVPTFLAVVYLIHVGLGHAMLAGIGILVALTWITGVVTGSHLRAAVQSSFSTQRRIDDVMQNAEAIEAMGMRAAMRNYWFDPQGRALSQASIAADRSVGIAALTKWVRWLLNLLMTALGAWYVIQDQITLGAMIAASIIAARGLAPLEGTIAAWKGLVGARFAAERINETLERFARQERAIQLPVPAGNLSIEHLVYTPPGGELPAIKGVSFSASAGAWIGLIGPSAAGKSTLAKLICGVWKPQSGVVRLDGADVYGWTRADFGRHCGYLPQDVELFSGSVRENIARFGNPDDAAIVTAAIMAGAHEMILRLPNGYNTQVGRGGSTLSAGQRQRVGLARALLGAPRLVVLDEPNSNLDADGEVALVQAVQRVKQTGATVLMISHRPSLLANADLLCVMVDGQIQHFGARDEVMARLQPKPGTRVLNEVPRGVA